MSNYSVVLIDAEPDGPHTVRVYDGAHGVNEVHRYTRSGGNQAGEVFDGGTLGEGMRAAIRQIETSYAAMIDAWRRRLSTDGDRFPAARAMDEAIELSIAGRSPYPENATFVDAEGASAGEAIKQAVDEGRAIVLAFADGSTWVLRAELAPR